MGPDGRVRARAGRGAALAGRAGRKRRGLRSVGRRGERKWLGRTVLPGPSGEESEREKGWAGLGCCWVLGLVSFPLLLLFLFLFKLTQSNLFEFKIEFEFNSNTQTNKIMLQHECNIKSKPRTKF